MKNFWIFCATFIFGLDLCAQGNQGENYAPDYKYSPIELQSDFNLFRWVLEKAHPGLNWYTSKVKMSNLMDSTYKLLDKKMTENEFYKLLAGVVAEIHCGHTLIDLSPEYQDLGGRLPIDLFFDTEGKAFIIKSYLLDNTAIQLKSQLLAVNQLDMTKIVSKILPFLPADALHIHGKYQDLEDDFHNYYYNLIAQPDSFLLKCLTPKGDTLYQKVPSIQDDVAFEHDRAYQAQVESRIKTLEMKHIDSLKTLIVSVHSFLHFDHRQGRQKFSKFLKQLNKTIKIQNIQNIVIDLRKNSGGNLGYVDDLFYAIAIKPYKLLDRVEVTSNKKLSQLRSSALSRASIHHPNRVIASDSGRYLVRDTYYTSLLSRPPSPKAFKGNVYLLTGEKSFSAATHFAILVDAYKRGTIIGEETGGASIGFNAGDIVSIPLPITNLQLEVPIEKCIKNTPKNTHPNGGVVPKYHIKTDINDFMQETDKALDFTLKLIKQKKQ